MDTGGKAGACAGSGGLFAAGSDTYTSKCMKKNSGNAMGRVVFIILAMVVQVSWIIFTILVLGNHFPIITITIEILSIIAVLWLVSKDMNPAYKLAWTILILAVPIAGAVIYFLFGRVRLGSGIHKKIEQAKKESCGILNENENVRRELAKNSSAECQSEYIFKKTGFPVYSGTLTRYFCSGEDLFPVLKEELEKAEHFIFMEYFIIDDGKMWQEILDILEKKVRIGVDVRIIYDDWGCASKMPKDLELLLRSRGIRCMVFNPLIPIASVIMNNRDHRKITVIDGCTAFTGGINLADEYINQIEKFGYWKDTAVELKGEAVWSFTVMFLQMWTVLSNETVPYEKYRPHVWYEETFEGTGFVQPYNDSPLDHESVGENVYLNIINRAEKYVYIFTPYLIIDNEMETSLCLAAKSGIDVRIVTPGIPDKKLVFLLTRSYYDILIKAGVKVYEFTPGFIHAKSFVCDDKIAVVGTVNLDYRSLFLHFECGVWMYDTDAVADVKNDADEVFKKSREITEDDCRKNNFVRRFGLEVLRLFAPLM